MLALIAVLATLAAGPAVAASFDCAAARRPAERAVCDDPESSALDDRLAVLYREVLAMAPWAPELRAAQRAWLAGERERAATDAAALRSAYRARIAALERERALARDPRWHGVGRAEASSACLPLPPAEAPLAGDPPLPCRVAEFGPAGRLDGAELLAARYAYDSPPGSGTPSEAGFVLFTPAGTGHLRAVLAARVADAGCALPALTPTARGPLLLFRCIMPGTGGFNADQVFAHGPGGWRALDVQSWLQALPRHLPKDLGAWKGIFPDYAALAAKTPLWRKSDPNCCPTGGQAEIAFRWQGDRLAIHEVRLRHEQAAAP